MGIDGHRGRASGKWGVGSGETWVRRHVVTTTHVFVSGGVEERWNWFGWFIGINAGHN